MEGRAGHLRLVRREVAGKVNYARLKSKRPCRLQNKLKNEFNGKSTARIACHGRSSCATIRDSGVRALHGGQDGYADQDGDSAQDYEGDALGAARGGGQLCD